jgi:sortase (surface protein transpeptidase)
VTHQTDRRLPARRPVLAALAALVLLAGPVGCSPTSSSPDETTGRPSAPATAASPTPSAPVPAPADVPDVPVRSAALADAAAPQPAAPVALAIPALGIAVPVDPVGVAPDGQMEIPPLAERAGWYRFGAAPGAGAGTAVVAAHVDSAASAGLGPFARLEDAAVGDLVEVTLADGSTRTFAVTDVRRTAKAEIAWADVFVRDGAPRLALITCGGVFQRDVGRYVDNVIVVAQPVGGPVGGP